MPLLRPAPSPPLSHSATAASPSTGSTREANAPRPRETRARPPRCRVPVGFRMHPRGRKARPLGSRAFSAVNQLRKACCNACRIALFGSLYCGRRHCHGRPVVDPPSAGIPSAPFPYEVFAALANWPYSCEVQFAGDRCFARTKDRSSAGRVRMPMSASRAYRARPSYFQVSVIINR